MKKLALCIASIAAAMLFAGCVQSDGSENEKPKHELPNITVEYTGETVAFSDLVGDEAFDMMFSLHVDSSYIEFVSDKAVVDKIFAYFDGIECVELDAVQNSEDLFGDYNIANTPMLTVDGDLRLVRLNIYPSGIFEFMVDDIKYVNAEAYDYYGFLDTMHEVVKREGEWSWLYRK